MRTVLLGERPPEVEELLKRRRALGQDLFDEVWDGIRHVVPTPDGRHGQVANQMAPVLGPPADAASLRGSGPCNIGTPNDYRVPDQAFFASPHTPQTFNASAAIVVEIVSPDDESRNKFDFYFRAGVAEVLIVDPEARTIEWFARADSGFDPAAQSSLLGMSAAELAELIDWPR